MRIRLIILLALVLVSCREVFEKDITNEIPDMIIPSGYSVVNVNPVHFKWNPLDGATKYRLEIVSPSFDDISLFAYDTVVSLNQIFLALDSLSYEYRITAMNAGYISKTYGPISFTVGSSIANNNLVTLTNPVVDAYLRSSQVGSFSWSPLANALSYEFTLRAGADFTNSTIIEQQSAISTTMISLPSTSELSEGIYWWAVKAYLSSGVELPFSKRKFIVDNTPPSSPSGPFSPSGNTINGISLFSWSNGVPPTISQSPYYSVLEIASDNTFSVIDISESIQGSNVSIDLSSLNNGTYFWRVKNIDLAGNESNYSTTQQFYVLQ